MKYRLQSNGSILTQKEIRKINSHISLPKTWDSNICSLLRIDPILSSPKPPASENTIVISDGVKQDDNGNWIETWTTSEKFNEFTDDDGVVQTVEDQQEAYEEKLKEREAQNIRQKRNSLLLETDWAAGSDLVMTDSMRVYRQALRDITDHVNFPNLTELDWPKE